MYLYFDQQRHVGGSIQDGGPKSIFGITLEKCKDLLNLSSLNVTEGLLKAKIVFYLILVLATILVF
jgi:hypothetical protein